MGAIGSDALDHVLGLRDLAIEQMNLARQDRHLGYWVRQVGRRQQRLRNQSLHGSLQLLARGRTQVARYLRRCGGFAVEQKVRMDEPCHLCSQHVDMLDTA